MAGMSDEIGYPKLAEMTGRDPMRAAAFVAGWYAGGQEKPPWTLRAMAYHMSMVLEGHDEDPEQDLVLTTYLDTKYGPWLYQAGLGGDPGEPPEA